MKPCPKCLSEAARCPECVLRARVVELEAERDAYATAARERCEERNEARARVDELETWAAAVIAERRELFPVWEEE